MRKFRLLMLLLVISAFIFTNCTKEGPEGPAGATGPQGPTGNTGPTGPQGVVGSANVIYSAWFTPATYTSSSVFGITNFDFNKAATGITQAILDNGVVLTYGKLLGYNPAIWPITQVGQLPINLTYVQGSTMTDTWTAFSTVGNLRINFVNSANFYTSISNAHQFRYVIIPGGVLGGRSANTEKTAEINGQFYTESQLKGMSYNDICNLVGINP